MQVKADRYIRLTTAIAVTGVSAIAAIISYLHIEKVSLEHGQTLLAARLMPLSVDQLVLAGSLTALYASRQRLAIPPIARIALIAGIGATVAVNMVYGLKYGALGAALSAWPAASFIVAVELLVWVVRTAAGGKIRRTTSNITRRSNGSALREWAKSRGYDIASRGRIPESIIAEYEKETPDIEFGPDSVVTDQDLSYENFEVKERASVSANGHSNYEDKE